MIDEKPVPCELCKAPTLMTATKRCDRCWELEKRIQNAPGLTLRILAKLFEGQK